MEYVTYIAIVGLCNLAGAWLKAFPKVKDELIPPILGTVGMILGIICFYIGIPDFPANNVVYAAFVGVGSGFAAVGINQAYKQLTKLSGSKE